MKAILSNNFAVGMPDKGFFKWSPAGNPSFIRSKNDNFHHNYSFDKIIGEDLYNESYLF